MNVGLDSSSLGDTPIRVSVVDDNFYFRMMLEEVISTIPGLRKMPGYGSLCEIRGALRASEPKLDYILLDIVLPDGKGWEVLDEEAIKSGRTKVFFATGKVDQHTLLYFAQHKVAGFIDKATSNLSGWNAALNCIASKQGFCSPALISQVSRLATDSSHWSRHLTPRELEILPEFSRGESNQDVSRKLSMSPATVQVHRKNIMRKLECSSTPELMRWAHDSGVAP